MALYCDFTSQEKIDLGIGDFLPMTYDDLDESFGLYDAECQVCDLFGRVDDLILCEECAGKLDRDLIRLRDWDYSVTAFGVPASKLEELRGLVVAQYGEELELIAPKEKKKKKKNHKHKKKTER